MTLSPAQMAHCIEHVGEIALYTRFMAVALMEAGPNQEDLAGLFLELAGGPSFPGVKATPEAAQALLEQVRAGYKSAWKRSKRGNPARQAEFSTARAVKDLETSPTWFRRIYDAYEEHGNCNEVAARFLHLRRSIFLERQEPIGPEQVAAFVDALEARILQLAEEIQAARGASVIDLVLFRERRRQLTRQGAKS